MSGPAATALVTRTLQIHHEGGNRSFTLFDTRLGYEIFQRILSGKTYPLPSLGGAIRTVVDIGANVGAASVYFALRCPGATVLAFEPSPDCFALLKANTADLAKVVCFPFGLFDGDRKAILYRGKVDPVTSSIAQSPEATQVGSPVELRDAAAALKAANLTEINILKIDTEGCELPILRSLSEYLPRTDVVFLEFHSERDRLEMDGLLLSSHTLFRCAIEHPCRGELCYIARRCFSAPLDPSFGIRL
jgi:FkbM family methyltransferase